jgi:hypothetical protein
MPSIAHLLLGGVIGMCLYYISSGKFSKTHVFVLFLNNYFGPDIGWALGPIGQYTHTLLGWALFAFVVTIFYHYFTRFTIKIDGIRDIELIDYDRPRLSYLNTYYLVLAGGILHNYLDSTMNYGGKFFLIPQLPNGFEGVTLTLNDFIELLRGGIIDANPVISVAIGIIFIIGFIYVFTYFIKDNSIKSGLIVITHVIAFLIYFYLVGGLSTGEHGDAGAIIYISLYWLPVLILCTLSTKTSQDNEIKERSAKKSSSAVSKSKLFYLITGILIILGGVALMIFRDTLFEFLLVRNIVPLTFKAQFLNALIIISIVMMGIGLFIILVWLKLKKIEEHHKNLLVISIWLYLIGLIGVILGLLGILLNELLVTIISSAYGILFNYVTFEEAVIIVTIFGIAVLILGLINFFVALGLTFKIRVSWKFGIYYHLILAWTIIGLTISCALSENEVKEIINKTERGKETSA